MQEVLLPGAPDKTPVTPLIDAPDGTLPEVPSFNESVRVCKGSSSSVAVAVNVQIR